MGFFMSFILALIIPFILIFLLAFYGEHSGKEKARRTFIKETNKIKLEDPYIYFREVPNNYGIAVSSVLLDFNLENKDDLVAEILDLCAKKYIKIVKANNGYEIVDLKKDRTGLLSSEIYVLEWILNISRGEFDYVRWKELAYNDALELNLVEKRDVKHRGFLSIAGSITSEQIKKVNRIAIIIAVLIPLILVFKEDWSTWNSSDIKIIAVVLLLYPYLGYITFSAVGRALLLYANAFSSTKKDTHNTIMYNTPIRTENGGEELRKLYAFGSFVKDFGMFANKHIDEIVIWERYLPYAQLFGLTEYILKTGYKQLLQNEYFAIESIEKLNLDNLSIKSN